MKKTVLFLVVWFSIFSMPQTRAQKLFKAHTVAFYNVENLFDTINDPKTYDDDRTPNGKDNWTGKIYRDKISKTARVISDIGKEFSKNAPVVIGLAEIENRAVLEDLVKDPQLIPYNYGIVHFDSPDERGIDVAFLYQKQYFEPENFSKQEVTLYRFDDPTRRDYTRSQLLVSGKLDGEVFHFIVNHWPSRSGGESRSRPNRIAAAKVNKKTIDSLQKIDPKAKIIGMGDFNDDPTNVSMKEILKTKADKEDISGADLFNPMENLYKKGVGSLGYRDSWNLFDQIYMTAPLVGKDYSDFKFYKAGVFNAAYLIAKDGRYKGYPFRSFADGGYTGGYSDHFPTYIQIIKETN